MGLLKLVADYWTKNWVFGIIVFICFIISIYVKWFIYIALPCFVIYEILRGIKDAKSKKEKDQINQSQLQ